MNVNIWVKTIKKKKIKDSVQPQGKHIKAEIHKNHQEWSGLFFSPDI